MQDAHPVAQRRSGSPRARAAPRPALAALAAALACALLAALLAAPQAQGALGFELQWGVNGSGDGQFNEPTGVATDAVGDVYVADAINRRIQKFGPAGAFLAMWGWGVDTGAGQFEICTPASLPCQAGVVGSGDGQFHVPLGVAIDAGNAYVADSDEDRIQIFHSGGAFLAKWGMQGSGAGELSSPRGLATDAVGDVYVADAINHRIQKFGPAGAFLAMWGWGVDTGADQFEICTPASLPCQAGASGDGERQFSLPRGIATDPSGDVYVADENHRIQKLDSSGSFLGGWGTQGDGEGQFGFATGLATDAAGNVYVADAINNRIQKFAPGGAFLAMWGWGVDTGAGQLEICTAASTPCGPGTEGDGEGQFNAPLGIAIDAAGDAYVADAINHRIQKFALTPPGTVIDSGPAGPTNDATPSFTFFSDPEGATFECRLHAAGEAPPPFGPCSGPGDAHSPGAALPEGDHVFEVRAIDDFGDVDPAPPKQDFTVDTTPPVTEITSGPPDLTNDPTPTFTFAAGEPATFECSLVAVGDPTAFAPCSGPGDIHTPAAPLADGDYTFAVRATDAAGNPDPDPPARGFTIDTTSAPPAPIAGEIADVPSFMRCFRRANRARQRVVRRANRTVRRAPRGKAKRVARTRARKAKSRATARRKRQLRSCRSRFL